MHLLTIRNDPKNDRNCFALDGSGHTVNGLILCRSTSSSPLFHIQPTILSDFGQMYVFYAEMDKLFSSSLWRIDIHLFRNISGELAPIIKSSAIFTSHPSAIQSPSTRVTNSSKYSAILIFLRPCGATLYTYIPLNGEIVPYHFCDSLRIGIWK